MTEKDAIYGKISNIKNCLNSIKKITGLDPKTLEDQINQDIFVLNLQRAAQAAIDMAHLVIANKGFELPRSYKHAFSILNNENIIDSKACEQMTKMAGFRNIAIHDYTNLNVEILKSILINNLEDFERFYSQVYVHYK